MKLYHSPTSPYVRKVMVVLHETGQLDEVTLEPASGTPLVPAANLGAANPLTKVPALERPDGATLYDSRVICRFFADRAGSRLYPDGARIWETLTLEATGDGITDAALAMTYESRLRPDDKQMPAFADAQWQKIANACAALNARWLSHLSGPLDAGQISVACALAYVDFRHDSRGWRVGNAALADWYAGFAGRASMLETVPPLGA